MKEGEKLFLITSKDVEELEKTINELTYNHIHGVTYGEDYAPEYKETAKLLIKVIISELRKKLKEVEEGQRIEEVRR